MTSKIIPFYSQILGFEIPLEVTGDYGYPILMFPTSRGGYTQNKDFGLLHTVENQINAGKIKVYNVATIDDLTFYENDFSSEKRIENYEKYMQFLSQELIPYIQKECNTHRIATGGCSFGGYHASNLAFRFPDLVSHLFSMSGIFNIRSYVGYTDDIRVYYNSPEEFISNEEGWKYNHMNIVLNTSDRDICRDRNLNMAHILASKGINIWYDERKWADHDWPLWKMVFPEYVNIYFN